MRFVVTRRISFRAGDVPYALAVCPSVARM